MDKVQEKKAVSVCYTAASKPYIAEVYEPEDYFETPYYLPVIRNTTW